MAIHGSVNKHFLLQQEIVNEKLKTRKFFKTKQNHNKYISFWLKKAPRKRSYWNPCCSFGKQVSI